MNSLPVIETADSESIKEGSSLFQSGFWASFKSFFGWKPFYFLINGKNLIVLVRNFKALFSIAYVPFAPDFEEREHLLYISSEIRKQLPKNCLFIRYDLPWIREESVLNRKEKDLEKLVKSSVDIQPPSTVILDITADEEEILSGMKSKTRYNIRLSARKGVTVRQYGVEALDEWYDIYTETAERDKIELHRKEYYKKLFTLAEAEKDSPDLRIYMAEVEGENIAGIITSFYRGKAVYLYGASLNKKRETMPAYSLQWKALIDAKKEGCSSYDFFGIPLLMIPPIPCMVFTASKQASGAELSTDTDAMIIRLILFSTVIIKQPRLPGIIITKKLKSAEISFFLRSGLNLIKHKGKY